MIVRSTGILLISLLACSAHASEIREVGSERVQADASAKREQWRDVAKAEAVAPTFALPALAPERIEAMQRRNRDSHQRRYQIGITRSVASEAVSDLPQPQVSAVAGGAVLRLDVTSTGAQALRVGLRVAAWPDGVELRVAGTVFGDTIYAVDGAAARAQADPQGVYWTAVTDGERQRLELFVPAGVDPASVRLAVNAVSHLVVGPQASSSDAKALGDSGSCNKDVVCRTGTLGQTFVDLKDAVARMTFQSDGGTFTCTGTLLNDNAPATQIPWFYTAHHCIGNQTEASSVTTFWKFETPTCGVNNTGPNIQVPGGAQLLYSQASTDGALLRLNNAPPGGSVLLGWNAGSLATPTSILGVHHPRGDIKKVSTGSHSGVSQNVDIDGQILSSALRATWSEGTTEGGSSGSGLFTFNGGWQLRGGLAGGTASCSNSGGSEASGNRDFYSRLELVFPSIQQYLLGGTTTGPTRNYTGQWDLRSEPGSGLSMLSFGGDTLFVLWFVYDSQGRPTWYQLDLQWTGSDVAGGRVVRITGTPWGQAYNPNARVVTQTGTFTLTFTSETQATFAYNNVDGASRTITLTKY